jgi:hypothetical protein
LDIIQNFVIRDKQERFRGFIAARRDDLLDELFIDERNLKPETLIELPRGKSASYVISELERRGATDEVYVMSSNTDLDAKLTRLKDAVESVFDRHCGVLIYCINKRIGYYEDGETSKYILDASKER